MLLEGPRDESTAKACDERYTLHVTWYFVTLTQQREKSHSRASIYQRVLRDWFDVNTLALYHHHAC